MLDLGKWMNEDIGLPHVSIDEEEADLFNQDEEPQPIREWKFD